MASNADAVYSLSTELHGHTGDVRAVQSFRNEPDETTDYVLTASRDKTACIWKRTFGSPDMVLVKSLTQHTGFVSALCVIPADISMNRDNALIVTAGQDKVMMVHSMDPSVTEPLQRYNGHTSLISAVIYQSNQLLSVSWDSTMRVWNTDSNSCCSVVEQAHEPAVWCIAGLYNHDNTRRVLTGGADKSIKLWETDNKLCVQEYRGHSDVVRDVKVINGELFLSASNDCTVRKWNMHTAQCLMEFCGHEAFVYSISIYPGELNDDFVSSGEDGTLRIWKNGVCVQQLQLPAISVWCVCVMDNNDIVTGSSDSVARVYSASTDRMASSQQIMNYQMQVDNFISSKNNKSIDVSTLPKMSALSEPGKSTGDTKLVNNGGRAEVYQWNASTSQWEKIGDALGEAPPTNTSTVYNGKEYDYVFDIEIDDQGPNLRKIKLPYNKGDDPYEAAERFITNNDVPVWYLDQIAEFIIQNANVSVGSSAVSDPFTGGNRYIPGQNDGSSVQSGQDPFTGTSRYVPGDSQPSNQIPGRDPFTGSSAYTPQSGPHPSKNDPFYPLGSCIIFISGDNYYAKVIDKMKKFKTTIPECQINETDLSVIEQLCSSITTPPHNIDTNSLSVLSDLLKWPQDNLFPVLDIIRLVVLTSSGNSYYTQESVDLISVLQCINCGQFPKNQLLVLRILSNMLYHSAGQQWFKENIKKIVEILDNSVNIGNKNSQIALSTVILNYSCSTTDGTCDGFVVLALKILRSDHDFESKYRILLFIGTISLANKILLVDCVRELLSLIAPLCDVTDHSKIADCSLVLMEGLLNL